VSDTRSPNFDWIASHTRRPVLSIARGGICFTECNDVCLHV
jgi:hypothetical protein